MNKNQVMSSNNHNSSSTNQDSLYIKHPINKRADASWVLYQILEHGRSASEVMPKVWNRHEKPQDRAWLQEMVYGCLRNLPILQVWLRLLLNKPLKKQQKIIEHLLMLGLYQLAFSRTAQHAAVSETVDACKQMKELSLSGLVNAVLRRFQREDLQSQTYDQAHIALGLPKWLYRVLNTHYGATNNIENLAKEMHTRAPLWLRVNTQKTNAEAFEAQLKETTVTFEAFSNNTFKLENAGEIMRLPGFDDGHFAVQDYAAQQAARLLGVKQGDIVLDCCAAPGGKSAGILETQPDLSHLYILDSDARRMQRVHENFDRLGHTNRFANKTTLVVQDACDLASNTSLPDFDKILLDAPCSATGVIRRHPDIMWLRKAADIDVLVELQQKILESAWQKLKSGGTLLYATCSILPQENQDQIERFIATHNDATLDPITTIHNKLVDTWQILPGQDDMDGFFYARLNKG
jgi:16S rRNA (cytosine967-C5)-methyltransferase